RPPGAPGPPPGGPPGRWAAAGPAARASPSAVPASAARWSLHMNTLLRTATRADRRPPGRKDPNPVDARNRYWIRPPAATILPVTPRGQPWYPSLETVREVRSGLRPAASGGAVVARGSRYWPHIGSPALLGRAPLARSRTSAGLLAPSLRPGNGDR